MNLSSLLVDNKGVGELLNGWIFRPIGSTMIHLHFELDVVKVLQEARRHFGFRLHQIDSIGESTQPCPPQPPLNGSDNSIELHRNSE
jgi:hypothetical protein